MKKPHLISPTGIPNQFDFFEKQVSIFIDYLGINTPEYNNSEYKVFISGCEPPEIYNVFYNNQNVIDNYKKFDLILAASDDIIKNCPNAKTFPFGSGWVEPLYDTKAKESMLSFLCGSKKALVGHKLRHQILLEAEEKIQNKLKKNFLYSYSNDKKADWLYPAMFTIVVENTQHKNYFTEKIIDCMLSKSIPIYWGCPNINDYFDKLGIIKFNNIEELIVKCNLLTPDLYESKKEIIKKNFEEALIYKNYWKRVSMEIQKDIK
jgi:hypothetical protein